MTGLNNTAAFVKQFPIGVELPPMSTFRSRRRGTSPLGLFEKWLRARVGDPTLGPNDCLLKNADMTLLMKEVTHWIRAVHGRTGEALRRAVNFHDVDRGPMSTSSRAVRPGFAYIKRPDDRAAGANRREAARPATQGDLESAPRRSRRSITFRAWLRKHEEEDSPVGDLARDLRRDPRAPRGPLSPDRLRRHITEVGGSQGAQDALKEATSQWRTEAGPQSGR